MDREPVRPDFSRSTAVLIGVSRYLHPAFGDGPDLTNSLTRMRDVLSDPGLCGWPADRITTIDDATSPSDLGHRLHKIAQDVEDVLLVY